MSERGAILWQRSVYHSYGLKITVADPSKDGTTFDTSITLIALHHGELTLPKVAVTALPIDGEDRMRSIVVPSCSTHQVHGAETVLILPRGGRTTFVVDMGDNPNSNY